MQCLRHNDKLILDLQLITSFGRHDDKPDNLLALIACTLQQFVPLFHKIDLPDGVVDSHYKSTLIDDLVFAPLVLHLGQFEAEMLADVFVSILQ